MHRKRSMASRILALALSAAMAVTSMPTSTLAENMERETAVAETGELVRHFPAQTGLDRI